MKKIVFGDRNASPAFFDMGARFKPRNAGWYGGAFRIGDRAAAHIWLADWRHKNPGRRLVVVEDSVMPGTEYSRALPGTWLFGNVADELWVVEKPGEQIMRPPGQTLYHVTMWRIWRWLMVHKTINPTLIPPDKAMVRAREILAKYGAPAKFVTCQPLFDASYDKYRNAPVSWWKNVVLSLRGVMPVALLGLPDNARKMPLGGENIIPLWQVEMDAMTTLAIICHSSLHVGGATGTTLWAPIFKIPVLACYVNWAPHPGRKTDTRPMSFGKPVVYAQLGSEAKSVALTALGIYNGTHRHSTPL
jgi:hypothetical protein